MILKRLKLVSLSAALFLFSFGPAVGQGTRSWTATTGHELQGTLVDFTTDEVTLKDEAGQEKVIKRSLLSQKDLDYLKGFPGLESKSKRKGKLPWVEVRAKSASWGKKDGLFTRTRRLAAEITLSNRSSENLSVDVLWVFYGEPVKPGARFTTVEDLIVLEPRAASIDLKASEILTFQTQDAKAREYFRRSRWQSGMKIHGYVAQVYLDGQLLNGFSSANLLKETSEDPNLLETFKNTVDK